MRQMKCWLFGDTVERQMLCDEKCCQEMKKPCVLGRDDAGGVYELR
jgi:hypothetical protein